MSEDLSAIYYKDNRKNYKKADERYQSLSKKEKEIKQQCRCDQYKNLHEDEKQRLVEYRKEYCKIKKTPCYNQYCMQHKTRL